MLSTVIVALYNGERFIKEQLDSIKNQTIEADEVIIADDGSKDQSIEIVKRYIQDNNLSKWRLVVNEVNKGWAKNFISNASVAKGKYIFFSDQDDMWAQNKIEVMIDTMEKNKNINLLCGDNDFICYDGYNQSFDAKDFSRMKNDGSLEKVVRERCNIHLKRPGCAMCIRKEFFDSILPYWVEKWGHDDFCWKYAVLSDSCYYIHRFLITRRRHSSNTARNEGKRIHRNIQGRINQLEDMRDQYKSLERYIEEHKINREIEEYINHNLEAINLRIRFITTKNPLIWLRLFAFFGDTYPRKKGLYLDFGLVYLGEKICQKF